MQKRLACVTSLMLAAASGVVDINAQASRTPNWSQFEQEALTHFQAIVRMDTSDPPWQ